MLFSGNDLTSPEHQTAYHRTGNTRLERRLYFLLIQLLEVNVVPEEWMLLDLLSAIDPQALRGVARKQTRQNATSGCSDVIPENKRIAQDLLVHPVRYFWRDDCQICIER